MAAPKDYKLRDGTLAEKDLQRMVSLQKIALESNTLQAIDHAEVGQDKPKLTQLQSIAMPPWPPTWIKKAYRNNTVQNFYDLCMGWGLHPELQIPIMDAKKKYALQVALAREDSSSDWIPVLPISEVHVSNFTRSLRASLVDMKNNNDDRIDGKFDYTAQYMQLVNNTDWYWCIESNFSGCKIIQ